MKAIATESVNTARQVVAVSIWMILLLCPGGAAAQSGLSSPTPVGPFLDNSLPSEPPGFDPNAALTPENYFPSLTFVEPIRMIEHPSEDKLIVISKDGTFWLVDNVPGATNKTLFLDLSDQIQGISSAGEGGVGGFVFHPEFGDSSSPNRGYVYVWYRWSPNPGFFSGPDHEGYERLSRFTVPDGATAADPSSELILIQQFDRSQNHIGGDMFFGTDGFLYLSVGDEGNCCDRIESTQRLDGGLFSGLLRIDVDKDSSRSHPIVRQPQNVGTPPTGWPDSFTQEYYIPDDNPFVDSTGGNLEEFYALGLRHPWTVQRDPDTGNIWTADVGHNNFEEVDIVQSGHNYQWAYKEGKTGTGLIAEPSPIIGIETPPIWDYDHDVGQAIIGAGVYRGTKHPDLFGKYIVSDFLSGLLWALEGTSESDLVVEQIGTVPAGFPSGINSYLLDRHGRILMAQTAGALDPNGTIQELVADGTPNPEPPMWLSQTAAFDNVATLDVHDGCIPYGLIEPFWSDAALKSRWLCVPNDGTHDLASEQIVFSENGEWQFPVGTVLIKHFEILLDEGDPSSAKRLETRFIVHSNNGYYGITYKWLADESDAELLTTSVDETLNIVDENGIPREQVWHYPSRSECLQCHTTNAGSVLGPKTRQLNKDITYPSTGITANQLSTMDHLGMFDVSISDTQIANFLTMVNSQDQTGALEDRARTYLDSNCSHCHRLNGVRARFDARYTVPLSQQGLLYGELEEPTGVEGEAVIVPGNLELSRAYQRAAVVGTDAMPPLAKNKVDDMGISVLADWIDQAGLIGNSSDTDGSFIDSHHPSLYFNEADVLTNDTGQTESVTISEFRFYARNLGNPVTPIVAKVKGDNSFEVVAIGTTRVSSEYQTGENRFPFDDNSTDGSRVISLAPGDSLITGFSDSVQPGGTGWGAGSVIPADTGTGEDEIWALLPDPLIKVSDGFVSGVDTPSVEEGEDPLDTNAGKSLQEYTNLQRSYRFGIVMVLGAEGTGTTTTTNNLVANGSFENPTVTDNDGRFQYFQGSELPDWFIPFGDVDVVSQLEWSAADGTQSLDLNGTTAGAVEQTVDLDPLGQYELSVQYAAHAGADSGRSADVKVNGVTVGSLSTTNKVPAYEQATFDVQPDGSGVAVITIESTSFGTSMGLIIDDVTLVLTGTQSACTATENLAPFGTPSQSSTFSKGDYHAGLAINLILSDFTHTARGQVNPWWRVDWSEDKSISTVTLHNRSDCCGSRLRDITVEVLDSTGTAVYTSDLLNPENTLNSPSTLFVDISAALGSAVVGRTVRVTRTSDPDLSGTGGVGNEDEADVLSLAEVDVQGCHEVSEGGGGNSNPTIEAIADQTSTENDTVSLSVNASDPDGDSLTYGASGLPADLAINSSTGEISGTLATGSQGTYTVTVTVDDGNGGSASTSFGWTVNPPSTNTSPSITSIADQTNTEGDTVSLQVSASDPDGDTLAYSATGLPADLTIDSSTGLIGGTLATGSQGTYSVFVSVDDGNGGTANTSFSWTVNTSSGNTSPDISSIADQSNLEGDTVSLQVSASDPDGDTLTYSAAGLPANLAIDSSTGLISGTLATGSQGTYNVTVVVDDGNGGTASTSFDWTVTTGSGGSTSLTNGSFEEPIVTANNGSHQYFTGSEVPGWLITGDIDIVRDAFEAADGSQALDLNGTNAGSVSQTLTGLTVGTTYQLSVQWARHPSGSGVRSADVTVNGDVLGSLSTSTKLPPYLSSAFDFTPASDGSAEIAFVSTSLNTSVGIVIDNVQIGGGGAGNSAPSVSSIAAQTNTEGDTVSLQVSASDPDGDALTYSASGLPANLTIDSSTGLISGTLATGSQGTYSVIVTVDDGNGGTDSTSFGWEVNAPTGNTSPSISSIAAQTDAEGETVSLQVSASDPDGDTLTYSAAGLPANLAIDSSTGLISGTLATGSQGTYNVTVAVDDGNGGTASTSFDWTVTTGSGDGGSIVNGSFEEPIVTANNGSHQYFTGSEVPGWLITGDIDIVRDAFEAADGLQAMDLNGTNAGSVSQTLTGLTVGTTYQLSVQWARHPSGSGVRSADVTVNGDVVGTLSTSTKLPPYNTSIFDFTPASDGSAEIAFVSTSLNTTVGIVIDDVQVTLETPSGSPAIQNGDFESDGALGITTVLTDWTVTGGNVEIQAEGYSGTYALDLNGSQPGTIEQVISDLTPGSTYTLYLVWADQSGRDGSTGALATGEIYIDGGKIGDMRTTGDAPFFVDCNGFSFVPTNSQVTLQIKSTTSGEHGLLVDAVRLEIGGLPQPPSSTQIVNGGFETPLDPPDRDPHVCGFDLPGWLVTQENVDIITNTDWGAPEGASILDLGGHGPGGIAQTITGLTPDTTYRLSFQYARHQFWNSVDSLTADVLVDGVVVLSVSRDQTQAAPNWESTFVDFVAPSDGEVTIEFKSTSLTVGGGVVIDDIAVQETP